MDLRHLFREKMFHQSVLCVFFSGQLAYWMKPSPQTSNPLKPHTPPPSPFRSFGCILQLPSPPLAIQPSWRRDKKQEEMGWGGRGGVWVGSCSGGGRLEKESESVAPTESAEGQWAEIGPLVRGYSLKMWSVSHWAGTVDDEGTPVLMKSSLLSYQSLRVWGVVCVCIECLCEKCVWQGFAIVSVHMNNCGSFGVLMCFSVCMQFVYICASEKFVLPLECLGAWQTSRGASVKCLRVCVWPPPHLFISLYQSQQ